MVVRADPKVDYAFKRVYGDQRNQDILVHLLNAILRPEVPIRSVEIRNPFSEKDFSDDKLTVLDVRARDESGRLFDVEMQLLLPIHFKGRILHYWAGMFREQIKEGDSYGKLRPAISICLVNQSLFPAVDDYHLVFELVDVEHRGAGIRAFTMEPGYTITERGRALGRNDDTYGKHFQGDPPEVAGAVIGWLADEPAADRFLGKMVHAQAICKKHELVPGWPPAENG